MEIGTIVKEYIISELMVGERGANLDDAYSLIENGVLDSLGIMKLIHFIEERFSFSIEDEDILPENFESIEYIVKFIKLKLK